MDINLGVSVTDTLKNASNRPDGIAMYCVLCIFLTCSLIFGLTDFWTAFSKTQRWDLVLGSVLMMPITFLMYVWFAVYSSSGKKKRLLNAVLLLAIPLYFYWKIL